MIANVFHDDSFDNAPVAMHEIDTNGVIRRTNRAECALLGYQPEDLIGRHVWTLVAGEERASAQAAVMRKIAREQPILPFLREYKRKDGHFLVVEIHERLITDENDYVLGIRSALVDTTQQRSSLKKALQERVYFENVLRSMGDALIATDAMGAIQWVNTAAAKLIGAEPDFLVGRDFAASFRFAELDPKKMRENLTREIVSGAGPAAPIAATLVREDAEPAPCTLLLQRLVDAQKVTRGVVVLCRPA